MQDILCRIIKAISSIYITFPAIWLLAYLVWGDRFGYLGMVTMLAQYLFVLLPLVLLAGIACRSRYLTLSSIFGILIFALLWGRLFLPWRLLPALKAQDSQSELTVMTYNVLAYHQYTQPIIENIRHENPDIVMIQEMNFDLAHAVERELSEIYPYRVLDPTGDARGIGTISKYPIHRSTETLQNPLWVGGPVVVEMDWQGQTVQLVNFHFYPTTSLASSDLVEQEFLVRERQASLIVDFAQRSGPLIAAGDANASPLNRSVQIMDQALHDAWEEGGFGFGHTFPGSTLPNSDRPRIGDWYVPQWLVRIDYVFFSDPWAVVDVRMAPFEGVSDHRGVIARLRWKP